MAADNQIADAQFLIYLIMFKFIKDFFSKNPGVCLQADQEKCAAVEAHLREKSIKMVFLSSMFHKIMDKSESAATKILANLGWASRLLFYSLVGIKVYYAFLKKQNKEPASPVAYNVSDLRYITCGTAVVMLLAYLILSIRNKPAKEPAAKIFLDTRLKPPAP